MFIEIFNPKNWSFLQMDTYDFLILILFMDGVWKSNIFGILCTRDSLCPIMKMAYLIALKQTTGVVKSLNTQPYLGLQITCPAC